MAIPVGVLGFAGHGKDTLADVLTQEFGYSKLSFATKLKTFTSDLLGLTFEQLNDPVLKETYLCDHDFPFRNRSEFRARIPGALAALVNGKPSDFEAAAAGEDTGAQDHVASGLSVWSLYRQACDRIALYIEPVVFDGMQPTLRPTPRYLLQAMGTEVFRAIHVRFWTRLWADEVKRRSGRVVAPDTRFMSEVTTIYAMNGVLVRVDASPRMPSPDVSRMHSSETALLKLQTDVLKNAGNGEDFRRAVRVWAREVLVPAAAVRPGNPR